MSLVLNWIDKNYNHPEIFVSENGYPEPEGLDFSLKKLKYHHVCIIVYLNKINISAGPRYYFYTQYNFQNI